MTYTLLSCDEEGEGRLRLTVLSESGERRAEKLRFAASREDYVEAGTPAVGDRLFPEDYAILRRSADREGALIRAYRMLEAGDNGSRGLYQKLREKGFSAEASRAAVEELRARGLIDDEALLRRWVEDAVTRRQYGKRRLLAYFLAKGFTGDEIRAAIRFCEEEGRIDFAEARAALLSRFQPKNDEEKRRLLYRYGF